MNLSQRIHTGYILNRRTRVLRDYMASIIPEHLDFSTLAVAMVCSILNRTETAGS